MQELPLNKVRKIATALRDRAQGNTVSFKDAEAIARKNGIASGEVVGVARDISMKIVGLPGAETKAAAADANVAAKPVPAPVPSIVRDQILKGGIYKMLGEGTEADDFVIARRGQFVKERQAIRQMITGLEEQARQDAERIAELTQALAKAKAQPPKAITPATRQPSPLDDPRYGSESDRRRAIREDADAFSRIG